MLPLEIDDTEKQTLTFYCKQLLRTASSMSAGTLLTLLSHDNCSGVCTFSCVTKFGLVLFSES